MGLSNISFGYFDNVHWQDPSLCDFTLNSNVDIWRISVSHNLGLLDTFSGLMTTAEIDQANRFHRIQDKQRYIITRGAIKLLLGKYTDQDPQQIAFVSGKNNKPYLMATNGTAPFFNISHSADYIAIAISDTEIGIDTEHINQDFKFADLIAAHFDEDEIAFINAASSVERFFLLWTRKESLIKATAKALDDDISLIPSLDGTHLLKTGIISSVNNWSVDSFSLTDNYMASVATSLWTKRICLWDSKTISSARFSRRI